MKEGDKAAMGWRLRAAPSSAKEWSVSPVSAHLDGCGARGTPCSVCSSATNALAGAHECKPKYLLSPSGAKAVSGCGAQFLDEKCLKSRYSLVVLL
jgi:hypothetical protein